MTCPNFAYIPDLFNPDSQSHQLKMTAEQFVSVDSVAPDPVVVLGTESIYEGPWMSARRVKWRHQSDPADCVRVWEMAERTKKVRELMADGVVVVPLLLCQGRKFFITVKQWRIPISGWSLEFPAGLLDKPGETVVACATRELLEETGYKATRVLCESSGSQTLDPGLSSTGVNFVVVEVDGDLPDNRQPSQRLDDGEQIDVLLIPADNFLPTLNHLNTSGIRIEAAVYTFGLALSLNIPSLTPIISFPTHSEQKN